MMMTSSAERANRYRRYSTVGTMPMSTDFSSPSEFKDTYMGLILHLLWLCNKIMGISVK